jgi:cell wall-associated NlpC family hydrolase
MPTLSPEEIYRVALQAGFPPDRAEIFTAIALAESRGNTQANAAGSEDSRGLWQINVSSGVRDNTWGDLYDPLINARAAYEISGGGVNIQPWSVTHERHAGTQQDYRSWADEARAAAAAVGASPDGAATANGAVDTFVESALAQVGDPYVWSANASFSDADPDAFDCSELVEWAAHRAGVQISDGTWLQYLELQEANALTTVDQAIQTRGALLFYFSETPTPGGGRPSQAHVAISLGNGQIVEASGSEVQISPADPDRFNYAAVIPGLATAVPPAGTSTAPSDDVPAVAAYSMTTTALPPPTDQDGDGLTDHFESLLGTAPDNADSDADGLVDLSEVTEWQTNPLSVDTDADGVADGIEVADGADPGRYLLPDAVVDTGFGGAAMADYDGDGASDLMEVRGGSDRTAMDTDIDGIADGLEYAFGSDPDSIDSNNDGLTDGVALELGMLVPVPPPLPAPGTPDVTNPGYDALDPVDVDGM